MSWLSDIFAGGTSGVLEGAGTFAKAVREAITGKTITDPAVMAEIGLKAQQLEQIAEQARLTFDAEIAKAQAAVIMAEANGKGWLQNNWRPITMLVFVSIILNNQLIFPYVTTFGGVVPQTPLPVQMWELLKLGIGGYVVGRSAEKILPQIVTALKNKG